MGGFMQQCVEHTDGELERAHRVLDAPKRSPFSEEVLGDWNEDVNSEVVNHTNDEAIAYAAVLIAEARDVQKPKRVTVHLSTCYLSTVHKFMTAS